MSTIEWLLNNDGSAGKTLNPIRAERTLPNGTVLRGWHCEPIHEGCVFCYAEWQNLIGARGGTQLAYKPGHRKDVRIYLDEKTLLAPLHWRKPQRVFVCSMTDLFGAWVENRWLYRTFAMMALCPQHEFIVLTKRPHLMRAFTCDPTTPDLVEEAMNDIAPAHWCARELQDVGGWPLRNLIGGTSCSTQEDADRFIPEILQAKLARRTVSLEPLLGPIDLWSIRFRDGDRDIRCNALTGEVWVENSDSPSAYDDDGPRLDGVIAGGESGHNARATRPDWARALRDQCEPYATPFFWKQWGLWHPVYAPCDEREPTWHVMQRPDGAPVMVKCRGDDAHRMLDGVEHNGWPAPLPAPTAPSLFAGAQA